MALRAGPVAPLVVLSTIAAPRQSSSQVPAATGQSRSTIVLSASAIQDGTRYQYEISQQRASALPRWDERAGSEPPLSMGEARKAAEAWLTSRAPEAKTLEGVVRTDGTVGDVKVIRSLDTVYGLDEEAIKAFTQARFSPGTRLGQPVPVLVTFESTFTLR